MLLLLLILRWNCHMDLLSRKRKGELSRRQMSFEHTTRIFQNREECKVSPRENIFFRWESRGTLFSMKIRKKWNFFREKYFFSIRIERGTLFSIKIQQKWNFPRLKIRAKYFYPWESRIIFFPKKIREKWKFSSSENSRELFIYIDKTVFRSFHLKNW